MKQIEEYYVGFVGKQYLTRAIASSADLLLKHPFALIACIDSTWNVASLATSVGLILQNHTLAFQPLRSSIILPTNGLIKMLESNERLFTGFDEVWFFDTEPAAEPLENRVSLTSEMPLWEHSQDDLTTLVAVMRQSGSVAGFGDGCGLNFITSDKALAERITHAGSSTATI